MVFVLALFFALTINTAYAQVSDNSVDNKKIDNNFVQNIFRSGNSDVVDKLVQSGLDVNTRNKDGDTMLLFALKQNNLDMAETLIKAGADINSPSQNDGITPLVFMTSIANKTPKLSPSKKVMQFALEAAKLLIENGADINQETPLGTPLMSACTSDLNIDLVDLLIEAGANIDQTDINGRSALFYAVAFNSNNVLAKLLSANADAEIKDVYGKTYLDAEEEDFYSD